MARSTKYEIQEEMTRSEIADALGISITRVRQLEASALGKVRAEIMKHYPDLRNHFRNNGPETTHYDVCVLPNF